MMRLGDSDAGVVFVDCRGVHVLLLIVTGNETSRWRCRNPFDTTNLMTEKCTLHEHITKRSIVHLYHPPRSLGLARFRVAEVSWGEGGTGVCVVPGSLVVQPRWCGHRLGPYLMTAYSYPAEPVQQGNGEVIVHIGLCVLFRFVDSGFIKKAKKHWQERITRITHLGSYVIRKSSHLNWARCAAPAPPAE